MKSFDERNDSFIKKMSKDKEFFNLSRKWFLQSLLHEYSYHFRWLGRPIIQYPQDIVAIQEIIWKVKPDLIIETGIARGGSLILYASLLKLQGFGKVVGIENQIRTQNKKAIEKHALKKLITILEGSSVDEKIIKRVTKMSKGKKVLVILDSNHTHAHVLEEMIQYSKLVSKGSYLVVFDTVIEDISKKFINKKREWGKGNNPKTAVREFLKKNKRFKIDSEMENKLGITVAPSGYLKCIR